MTDSNETETDATACVTHAGDDILRRLREAAPGIEWTGHVVPSRWGPTAFEVRIGNDWPSWVRVSARVIKDGSGEFVYRPHFETLRTDYFGESAADAVASIVAKLDQNKSPWCPRCGPDVPVDNLGDCVKCSARATGPGAESAHAWRTWARDLLTSLGRQPQDEPHGDDDARQVIAQLARLAPVVPCCGACGHFVTRHVVDDEERGECLDCECRP